MTSTRPLWKRMAGHLRDGAYRAATLVEQVSSRRTDALVPPAHLRVYYYRSLRWDVFDHACQTARTELLSRGLAPNHRILDIGSGIGNLAVGLVDHLRGGYDGLEIHPEAVSWCQSVITPRHPTFRFHRADVRSRAYNPRGAVAAVDYRFPFADASFDFVFLASVFTHMLPDEVENYVREIARVLAPGGTCVASYFLLNGDTRTGIAARRSFMTFDVLDPSGLCQLHDAGIPEAAVALDETFVQRIHRECGLHVRDIRRGKWWSGGAHDQDLLTVVRKEDAAP